MRNTGLLPRIATAAPYAGASIRYSSTAPREHAVHHLRRKQRRRKAIVEIGLLAARNCAGGFSQSVGSSIGLSYKYDY